MSTVSQGLRIAKSWIKLALGFSALEYIFDPLHADFLALPSL